MFDPWTASFDEASLAQAAWAGELADPSAPIFQWAGARRIEAEKEAVKRGDGFAVLACIRVCVTNQLIAPNWLAYAFNRRYDKVLNCRSGSWDEAFGKPYAGKHVAKLRQRREFRFQVYNRVNEVRSEGAHYEINEDGSLRLVSPTPIDEALFERIGKDFRIGKTLCSELYYDALKRIKSSAK